MSKFKIRQPLLPNEYPDLVRLLNQFYSLINRPPVTLDLLKEEDEHIPSKAMVQLDSEGRINGFCRERFVISYNGKIVGYAPIGRAPWTEPGSLYFILQIASSIQHRGLETTLLQQIEDYSLSQHARSIMTEVPDQFTNEPHYFFQQHGFEIDHHIWKSTFSLEKMSTQLTRLEQLQKSLNHNFQYCTWDQLTTTQKQSTYQLCQSSYLENPAKMDEDTGYLSLEDFEDESIQPDHCWIALQHEQPVGACILLHKEEQPNTLSFEFIGVHPNFRRQHIAFSLLWHAIKQGARQQFHCMEVENDSRNNAIVQMVGKFGFTATPGYYLVKKQLKKISSK